MSLYRWRKEESGSEQQPLARPASRSVRGSLAPKRLEHQMLFVLRHTAAAINDGKLQPNCVARSPACMGNKPGGHVRNGRVRTSGRGDARTLALRQHEFSPGPGTTGSDVSDLLMSDSRHQLGPLFAKRKPQPQIRAGRIWWRCRRG